MRVRFFDGKSRLNLSTPRGGGQRQPRARGSPRGGRQASAACAVAPRANYK